MYAMNKSVINPDISIEELVGRYPKAVKILMEEGIVCIQCGEPVWGTLRDAAERKGITNIESIVERLHNSV